MKQSVILSIRGRQSYLDQEPEVIELVTQGTLEKLEDGWELVYEETELTGLQGVTTAFKIQPEQVVLTRTGRLNSQMVFREGQVHESLYQMEFGALMLSVMASRIRWDISEQGGVIDLVYAIEIEQTAAGVIDYHMELRPQNA